MTRVLVVGDSSPLRSVVGDALSTGAREVVVADRSLGVLEAVSRFDPDVVAVAAEVVDGEWLRTIDRLLSTAVTPTLAVGSAVDPDAVAAVDANGHDVVAVRTLPDEPPADALEDLRRCVADLADVDVPSLAVAQTAATARSIRATHPTRAPAGSTATEPAVECRPVTVDTDADGAPVNADPDRPPIEESATPRTPETEAPPTIVVGASTGGPAVVERLFRRLPVGLEARVLVVQHMPPAFTARFADRLDAVGDYRVSQPRDGDRIDPGTAVVAPGDRHLGVTADTDGDLRVRLEDCDRRHGVRPSIDVTMERAADCVDQPLCGVVLSGMGRDGATGIEAIDAAGGHTIAQDEATSPVFGIPARAIRTGCVDEVAPAGRLADRIVAAVTGDSDD